MDTPFDNPESWEWIRHNDLFEISGGSQPPKSKFISEARGGYIRLYQIRDYGNNPVPVYIPISAASKISHKGDILLARYGASLGKVFWAEDGAYNVAMARVIPQYETELISKKFLFLFYQSSLYQSVIHANSRSAQAGFNKEDLSSLLFPLPPRSEQERIVCAYEKLQPFLNAYDDAAHTLATINKDFPETLKKSILQEAVQGKLVPQDPSDEPAEALLERIRAEKQRPIKEGKIKKDKHESVIFRRDNSHYEKLDGVEHCIDDELPFEIPENWCWARLGSISSYSETKQKVNAANADSAIWGLDLEDIEKGGRLIVRKTVGERKAIGDKTVFSKGDILYIRKLRLYLLKILVAPECGICMPEIIPFRVYGGIVSEYIVNFLRSPYVDNLINSITYRVIGESVYQWKIIVFRFMIQCEYTIRSAARQSHSRDRPRQGTDRELLR